MCYFGVVLLYITLLAIMGLFQSVIHESPPPGITAPEPTVVEANYELIDAARNGDLGAVKASILRGAQARSSWGITGAAQNGHIEIIEYLLELGCDVNVLDIVGNTALEHAARCGQVRTIYYLKEKGADLNIIGRTPLADGALISAARAGQAHSIAALLKCGADINLHNSRSETAVYNAVVHRRIDCIKTLVHAGADLNVTMAFGHTAASTGIQQGYADVIEALYNDGKNGPLLLSYALRYRNSEAIRFLGDLGVVLNGCTLHNAAYTNDINVVQAVIELLQSKGISLCEKDKVSNLPLRIHIMNLNIIVSFYAIPREGVLLLRL